MRNKAKKNHDKELTVELIECSKCKGYGGEYKCFDGHNPVLVNPCLKCHGLGEILVNKEEKPCNE